jgi:hypothetical protein
MVPKRLSTDVGNKNKACPINEIQPGTQELSFVSHTIKTWFLVLARGKCSHAVENVRKDIKLNAVEQLKPRPNPYEYVSPYRTRKWHSSTFRRRPASNPSQSTLRKQANTSCTAFQSREKGNSSRQDVNNTPVPLFRPPMVCFVRKKVAQYSFLGMCTPYSGTIFSTPFHSGTGVFRPLPFRYRCFWTSSIPVPVFLDLFHSGMVPE